mmetsp:Transcript_99731/g.180000  ORF Transcript_99731/g.180000 Transcript_99731/m.180000 type:complete len:179 (-) Transcript_99731:374-910(-)
MPPKLAGKQNFSLGVTQLLDELLSKEEAESPKFGGDEDALRRTFQRTSHLCNEVEEYFKLMARDEEDAKREAEEKQRRAAKRLDLQDTCDFGRTGCSVYEALDANEAQLNQVRGDILQELRRREDRSSDSLAGTAADVDFAKLLAECDEVQAETSQWRGGLQNTPQGWRRMDPNDLNA